LCCCGTGLRGTLSGSGKVFCACSVKVSGEVFEVSVSGEACSPVVAVFIVVPLEGFVFRFVLIGAHPRVRKHFDAAFVSGFVAATIVAAVQRGLRRERVADLSDAVHHVWVWRQLRSVLFLCRRASSTGRVASDQTRKAALSGFLYVTTAQTLGLLF